MYEQETTEFTECFPPSLFPPVQFFVLAAVEGRHVLFVNPWLNISQIPCV